jgi:excisionase family DNA binding protein
MDFLIFLQGEPFMARVLTLDEVARYLRVHQSTVYRLLKKKELPGFKMGSDWRFNVESIDTIGWRRLKLNLR